MAIEYWGRRQLVGHTVTYRRSIEARMGRLTLPCRFYVPGNGWMVSVYPCEILQHANRICPFSKTWNDSVDEPRTRTGLEWMVIYEAQLGEGAHAFLMGFFLEGGGLSLDISQKASCLLFGSNLVGKASMKFCQRALPIRPAKVFLRFSSHHANGYLGLLKIAPHHIPFPRIMTHPAPHRHNVAPKLVAKSLHISISSSCRK